METEIDAVYEKGVFRPRKRLALAEGQKVRLTVISEEMTDSEYTALTSEEALGRIWNDPAEDKAWAHL